MKTIEIFCCLIIISLCNCTSNDNENNASKPHPIEYTDFLISETGCNWIWSETMHYSSLERKNVILINGKEKLTSYLVCNTTDIKIENIDFKVQSLLIVYGYASNGIDRIEKKLYQENSKYQFMIDITTNETEEAPIWTVAIVTHKITNINNVQLFVN